MEDLNDGVLPNALVLHVHHGVVLFRVKGLTLRLDLADAQLFQYAEKLLGDHLQALLVAVALLALGNAPDQVVVHLQKRFDGIHPGIGVDILLFLGGALAVVVVFRRQAQILVVPLRHQLSQLFHLFHLLFGNGKGFLCRLGLGLFHGNFRLDFFRTFFVLLFLLAHLSLLSSSNGYSRLPNIRVRLSAK